MDKIISQFHFFMLFTCVIFSDVSGDRRFSDYKRCADDECSMLLCRGKAAKDFKGPDCRFLTFKTGETIFVYYKLSGQRSDLWAGSVENRFGYFPKDVLNINHIYTEKETEVPAEETDFVCFDTGLDKFESYNVDVLLSKSVLFKENDKPSKNAELDQNEKAVNDVKPTLATEQLDKESTAEELDLHPVEPSQLPLEPTASEDQYVVSGTDDLLQNRSDVIYSEMEPTVTKDVPDFSKFSGVMEKNEHVTQAEAMPELATTLGTTFDAVTTDDKDTWKVTPSDDKDEKEEDSNELIEKPSEQGDEILKEPPLLSFVEKVPYIESNDEHNSFKTAQNVEKHATEMTMDDITQSSLEDQAAKIASDGEVMDSPLDDQIMNLPENDGGNNDEEIENDIHDDISKKSLQDLWRIEAQDSETNKGADKHIHSDNVDNSANDTNYIPVSEQENTTEMQEPTSNQKLDQHSKTLDLAESPNDAVQTEKSKIDSEDLLKVQVYEPETSEAADNYSYAESVDEESSLANDIKHIQASEQENTKDIQKILNDAAVQVERDTLTPNVDEEQLAEQTDKSEKNSKDLLRVHSQVKDTSEVAGKYFTSESVNEDPKTTVDAKYIQASEHDTTTEKHEIQGNEKSDLFNKALDLADSLNDDSVQSEPDTLTPILDDDEQTDRVKNNINIPDNELKKIKPETEEELEVYEEEEDIEQLLEDENAALANKTELSNNTEKLKSLVELQNSNPTAQTENHELVAPKQTNSPEQIDQNTSGQLNEDRKTDSETILELSKTPHEETSLQSFDSNKKEIIQHHNTPVKEPEYSDSVLRLTLLRGHFQDDEVKRFLRHLSLKDLFRIEVMFVELEQELKSARQSYLQDGDNLVNTLDSILEISENNILDEIEKMLDEREQRAQKHGQHLDPVILDEETVILDDFHDLAFSLHQKYGAVTEQSQSHIKLENPQVPEEIKKFAVKNTLVTEPIETEVHEITDELSNVNSQTEETHSQDLDLEEDGHEITDELSNVKSRTEETHSQDLDLEEDGHEITDELSNVKSRTEETPSQGLDLEEDGGHFNRNEDIQPGFQDTEEIQRGPQAILDNPLDMPFGFDIDTSSDSLDTPRASDFHDNSALSEQAHTSSSEQVLSWILVGSELLGAYTEILIASLPEEWQPGPTFHGLPWKPVVVTAALGVLTVLVFMWRTILAIKSRTYLLTEKQLAERIQQLVSEKSDVLLQTTELKAMIKEDEEKVKDSEKSKGFTQKELDNLKSSYKELCNQREELSVNVSQLRQEIANTQEEKTNLNEKISVMHKEIEKYQNTLKLYDEEHSKVQVVMDEAKLREDALKAQVLAFEKDNSNLKDQKKSMLNDARDWKEKHDTLSEEIKVYHKTQKELEDALVHKENEIDVLSGCISELQSLEACSGSEIQKGDARVTNGELGDKKGDPIKIRLKQMMDVSRIKAKLSVIEEERNRCLENFLVEQKARQDLEEQFQKVLHDQTSLKNEKTHLENQYKNLQQRLEITTELYQQKENALQQKLTQEELERREKETKLSEVDGQALQAEEELKNLRQKIKEMQEEMQQNEKTLKAEIATQEKKAHENWLKARASERSLIEEKRESANLRQKIVECSDKMADLEHALYKSGHPGHHITPLRRGDSFGPSPVSCGAPSPPLMIEGPGRPPSAPVGRRNEPFGPRPPSDTHGRFSDLGQPLPSRPDVFAPRTSSPCIQDGSQTAPVDSNAELSTQASTDTTEAGCRSQNQESFLPSPIRDSPVTASNAPPKAYGLQTMGGSLPMPLNGPLPPMMRPLNGHPPMIPPGLPFGLDPRFRPPPPMRPFGSLPPPLLRGLPPRDISMVPPPASGMHDFSSGLTHDMPFPHLPFPSLAPAPPGAKTAPLFGVCGQDPPMRLRDSGERPNATDNTSPKDAAQNTTISAMPEP